MYYGSEDLKEAAGGVQTILKGTYPNTEIMLATTDEQKSADVVVMLGRARMMLPTAQFTKIGKRVTILFHD